MNEEHEQSNERLRAAFDELSRRFDQLSARLEALENQPRDPVAPPRPAPPIPPPPPPMMGQQRRQDAMGRLAKKEPDFIARDFARREAINRRQTPTRKPKPKREPFKKPAWLSGTQGLIFLISLIGVAIFIVGIGFFFKLAIDKGWVSPTMRVLGGVGIGLALLAGGEALRRKVNALASSGVSAAGIGAIYASVLAAAKLYQLIDTPTAFAFLVVITIVGVLLGSLSNRVVLALLSLIAAFLVPVLLSTGEPSYVVMPAYLISLLVLGLFLSGWRGGAYSYVRKLAWWGTAILGTLWLVDRHVDAPVSSLVFVSVVWMATVIELVVSARFFASLRDRTKWSDESRAGFLVSESGEKTFNPISLLTPEARWINALFGVTAWAVVAAAMTIRELNTDLDYLAPLGFAIASLAVAILTVGKQGEQGSGLWAEHGSPRSALGAALVINGSLLAVATTATALGGWMQVVVWALLGLAAVETAKRIRFRAAGIFGFALVGFAVARLGSIDFAVHLLDGSDGSVLSIAYSDWTWQVLFVGAACAAVAWRSRYKVEAAIAGCVAMWLFAASMFHTDTALDSLGPALILVALFAAWISVIFPLAALRINAFVLAGIGMGVALLGQFTVYDYAPELDINVVSMVIAGLGWIGFAALPGAKFPARRLCAAVAVLAGAVAIWQTESSMSESEALLFESLYAAVLAFVGLRLFRWSLMEIAGILVCLVTLSWGARQIDLGQQIFDRAPFVQVGFWAAIVSVAVGVWIGLRVPKLAKADDAPKSLSATRRSLVVILFGAAWLLLLASTSIEAERGARAVFADGAVRGAAVSIWWSLFAVASIVLGFRWVAMLRWAGLGLLAVVAVKVLLFDTQVLNPAARVVAAMTVGLVIIGAGVLYAKMATLGNTDSGTDPDTDSVADDQGVSSDG